MNIKTAQVLLFINAVIWLTFGTISLVRLAGEGTQQTAVFIIIAVLMFGNAAAMLLAAWAISKQRKAAFFFALAVLLINILLTFTDQFGVFDLIALLIDLLILSILVAKKKLFFASPTLE